MPHEEEKKAFTKLFELEHDRLLRFCILRVSSRDLALEFAQESFARLWGRLVSGEKVENQVAFLYAIARNLIIDWYRRKKAVSLEALSGDEERPFDPGDERAHLELELAADASRVLELFSRLEDKQREVLHFRFVEDLPPREIARRLGLTPNAVSVRISRGLEALRRLTGWDKLN